MKLTRRQYLLTSALACSQACTLPLVGAVPQALTQPQSWAHPGGIIDFSWPKASSDLPSVKFGLKEAAVLDQGDHWRCLIGLPLDTLPGDYIAYIKSANKEKSAFTFEFSVRQKQYPLLQVQSTKPFSEKPDIPFSVLDFTNSVAPNLPWQLPVQQEWKSDFGQILIDQRDNTQTHQQLYASLKSNQRNNKVLVHAPQNGIVSNIAEHPKGQGQCIVIDHGRGLFSLLSGIDDLTIELGNGVIAGAALGTIWRQNSGDIESNQKQANGSNGGLQWQAALNDAFVDPLLLTQLL